MLASELIKELIMLKESNKSFEEYSLMLPWCRVTCRLSNGRTTILLYFCNIIESPVFNFAINQRSRLASLFKNRALVFCFCFRLFFIFGDLLDTSSFAAFSIIDFSQWTNVSRGHNYSEV